jgi:hypothetical protein
MGSDGPVYGFFAAPFRLQTYKNLLYLGIAFPLGLVYSVGFTVGASLGVGLSITIIGIPILVATVAATTVAAGFEAYITRYLTEVNASVPSFLDEFDAREEVSLPGDGFLDSVKRLFTSRSTWASVVLVLSKFCFGVVSFVALTVCAAFSSAMLAAPFIYDDPRTGVNLAFGEGPVVNYGFGPWKVDALPEALAVAVGGAGFLVISLNILNSLAKAQAKYTVGLLGSD